MIIIIIITIVIIIIIGQLIALPVISWLKEETKASIHSKLPAMHGWFHLTQGPAL